MNSLPSFFDFVTSPLVLIAYFPTLGAIAGLIAGIELWLAQAGRKAAFFVGIIMTGVIVAIWWSRPIHGDAMGAIVAPLAKLGAAIMLFVIAAAGLFLLRRHGRKTEVSREPI